MDVTGQVVVVTGAASGIGKALCESFYAKGAGKIVVSDIDLEGARQVADLIGGVAIACDVGREDHLTALVEKVEASVGAIGIFCSNAGVATGFDNSFTNVAGADDAVW